ncbi:probable nucleoside diphosphate kinase 5 isoform X3 [Nymphaea colorata]|uniref:probable nucleoside diphosphate kinase 5 isoform X3 n=2 Tax=Nymphaea colorata TaxID=210225 RepID=UPI00129D7708|nr:probable nucleoside diphosphate kinase 5 isoform X3 [Nymphaea colorata]XP_031489732.1 probable nucleoside diphosphate kinase 5 isoform X3 [Nymphaea colorata]
MEHQVSREMRISWVILVFILQLTTLPLQSWICAASTKAERTLAMIKPDGVVNKYADTIKKIIMESGFDIVREMMVQLDESNATIFYTEHSHKSFFPDLVKYMTSGPVYVMVLEKVNAISEWRNLIGPTDARKARISHPSSIRAMCGVDLQRNCVHGSDTHESAIREIIFFFGDLLAGFAKWEDDWW